MTAIIAPVLIFLVALLYRSLGIWHNHPFWVDEYSSANQARLILEHGFNIFRNPSINIEQHNIVTHSIFALFFRLFGQHEWTARLPIVIVGSLVPVVVYFLAKKLFDTRTAIAATLLTVFSYFQITWSRQARGYVLVQFLVLLTTYLYLQIKDDLIHSKKVPALRLIITAIVITIGFFTHALYLVFLCALALDVVLFNFRIIGNLLKKPYFYVFLGVLLMISVVTGHLFRVTESLTSNIFQVNNIWYYHSFLWREYGLSTFLGVAGALLGLTTRRKDLNVLFIYIIFQLLFISFFFSAYTSRYLLPIHPLILILSGYAITFCTDLFLKQYRLTRRKTLWYVAPLILIFFIIANGHKYVIKPKSYYSVNHDFREIALIDYHQVYNIIRTKGKLDEGKTAVIDTWHDRLYWYLGRDYQAAYLFRWLDEPGKINGLLKKTVYSTNTKGEKVLPKTPGLRLVGELSDLKMAMANYPRGFLLVDDSSLPKDVREYAEQNFKKELYLDHYPLDDNPYSIWPATLYSWGIK